MTWLLLALQAAPPTVDVEAGYDGVFFRDGWGRIAVIAQNPGEEIEVELRIRLGEGTSPERVHARRFAFPARSKRRFTWDVWLEDGYDEARAEILDLQGRTLASRVSKVRFALRAERQVLQVGEVVGAFGRSDDPWLAALRTSPELLPDDPIPLLAADVVVFAEPVALDPAAEDALLRWVELGGTLVFSSGSLPAALRRPFWRDVAPAEIGNPSMLRLPNGVVGMAEAAVRPGAREIFRLGDRPAGFRGRRGAGTVLFYACPLEQVGGLLREETLGVRIESEDIKSGVVSASELRNSVMPPERDFPLPRLAAGAVGLGAYALAIGPLTWFWLRRRRRPRGGRGAFLVLTAAACAFSTWWWGIVQESTADTTHYVWARPGLVQTISHLRAGHGGVYQASTPGVLSLGSDGWRFLDSDRRTPPLHGEKGRLSLPISSMAERALVTARVPRAGEIEVSARFLDAETVEIRNGGAWPLREAAVVSGTSVWKIHTLSPGATRTLRLKDEKPFALEDWMKAYAGSNRARAFPKAARKKAPRMHLQQDGALMGRALFERFAVSVGDDRRKLGVRGIDVSGDGRPLLVGRFDADLSGLNVEPSGKVRVQGVLSVPVEGP